MTSTKDIESTPPPTSRLPGWVAVLRPEHWIKNLLLFVALPFSGQFIHAAAWAEAVLGFVSFCLLASTIYILNDIRDRREDAAHPVKRYRPIAAGRLSPAVAGAEAAVLLSAGGVVAISLGPHFAFLAGAYVVLQVLYTAWLKQRAIIDVICVAMGFVLRASASAAAIGVPASAYLVLCTFMLCLFIALAKRRSEVVLLADQPDKPARRVSRFYTPERTAHMLSVSAGLSIVTYSLYCVDPGTVERLGSMHMVWTIPLVVYALFRYYCLTAAGQDDPVRILLRDRALWLVGLAWLAMVAGVIAIGRLDELAWLRGVLI